ncbi:hypothetical protein E5675_16785 [Sphingopyxis sp. PAMC25046]|nr:hypothetical protein E5675_16785 [Sphingopyxis sp. PAMC25046]
MTTGCELLPPEIRVMAVPPLRCAISRRKRGHTTGAIADYAKDKEAIVGAITFFAGLIFPISARQLLAAG